MRSARWKILFVCVVEVRVKEPAATHNDRAQYFVDKVIDKSIDMLFDRALKLLIFPDADLNNATMRKPVCLVWKPGCFLLKCSREYQQGQEDQLEENTTLGASPRNLAEMHFTSEITERVQRIQSRSNKSQMVAAIAALRPGDAAKLTKSNEVGNIGMAEGCQPLSQHQNEAHRYWEHFFRSGKGNRYRDQTFDRWFLENVSQLLPREALTDTEPWNDTFNYPNMSASALGQEFAKRLHGKTVLLEIGCALGGVVLPLLRINPGLFAFACDISSTAVDVLRKKKECQFGRCFTFACDVSTEKQPSSEHSPLLDVVSEGTVDFVTMLHVLCAIDPSRHGYVLRALRSILKPGGCLFLKDQGYHDFRHLKFLKFHEAQCLDENTYVDGDGKLSVFFELEPLKALFAECGFECLECYYVRTELKVQGRSLPRVKITGKFRRCD